MTRQPSTKRALRMILILMIAVICFAACGKDSDDRDKRDTSATATPTSAATEAVTPTDVPSPTEAPNTPAPTEVSPTPEPATPTPEPTTPVPTTPVADMHQWDDIGYENCYGRIAYADGYTWFVAPGHNSDGYFTGSPETDDIYRIADGADAKPELMASIPCVYEAGTEQTTVFYLMPYGDHVYFLSRVQDDLDQVALWDLNVTTGEMKSSTPILSQLRYYCCRYGNSMYFIGLTVSSSSEDGPEASTGVVWKATEINLENGTVSDFPLKVTPGSYDILAFNGIDNEYVYYLKYTEYKDRETCLQMRHPIGGGDPEELVSVNPDFESWPRVLDRCLFYSDKERDSEGDRHEYVLFLNLSEGRNVAVGEELVRLDADDLTDEYAYTVHNGFIYYIVEEDDDSALYRKPLKGEDNPERLMTVADGLRYPRITFCGDWLFCFDGDHLDIYRTKQDAKSMPIVPIVDQDSYVKGKTDASGTWEYNGNETAVFLTEYLGAGGEVTAPAEIDGKPVRSIDYWMPSSRETVVTKLVIPEGVYTLRLIEDRNIEELYIPSSVKFFTFRGAKYTINIKEGGKVYYAGTMEQWKQLTDFNSEYFSDVSIDVSGTKNLTVVCTDGELPNWGE